MVLLIMLIASGVLAARASGVRWKTSASVVRAFKARPLTLLYCPRTSPSCSYIPSTGIARGWKYIQVHVIAATARGIGPKKTISGKAYYGRFEVRVCALNYLAGGARVSAHLLWHTGVDSPALRKEIAVLEAKLRALVKLIHEGRATPTQIQLAQQLENRINRLKARLYSNRPYAEDWNYRGLSPPVMHNGC
jgi:hypothetical protein